MLGFETLAVIDREGKKSRKTVIEREHGSDIAAQLASEAKHARNGWKATQWASGDLHTATCYLGQCHTNGYK